MALRISSANRPMFDEDGFCHGVVKNVSLQEARQTEDGQEIGECIKWEFETPGTLRPYLSLYWTGLTVAPVDEKGHLSKLSRLCVVLGLLTEDDLGKPDIDYDLEQAIGLTVKYRLQRTGGLYRLDDTSLALDTDTDED